MDSKVCKFHPRQMQWKPFLSPPRICRFFAKHMVMWATSPTFGASSLNKWKVGPTFEQYFVQSLRTLKHKFWRRRRQCKALPGNGNAIYALFEHSSFFCNCLKCLAWKGLPIGYPGHSVGPFGIGAKRGHRVHRGSVTQCTRWHRLV